MLDVQYQLLEGTVASEGKTYRTYGIAITQDGTNTDREFHDIATDREAVARLVKTCNESRLDPMQLREVVEDFLISV